MVFSWTLDEDDARSVVRKAEEFSPTCPCRPAPSECGVTSRPVTSSRVRFDSEPPRLDVRQVLKKKIWATTSENWSRDGIAAWPWLTHGQEVRRGLPSEYSLSAAKFSRLVAVADVIMPLPILSDAAAHGCLLDTLLGH